MNIRVWFGSSHLAVVAAAGPGAPSQAVQRASSAQAALHAAASARRLARPGSITQSCMQFARCLGGNMAPHHHSQLRGMNGSEKM